MTEFSHIICDAPSVRRCFDDAPGWHLWWRVVLALHGKPARQELSEISRETTLRAGLRFYVGLYRFLALCLAGCAVAIGLILGWNFAAFALLVAAILLLPITSLGMRAALRPDSFACLFFAALIAYLSLLLGAAAVVAGTQTEAPAWMVLSASVLTFLLGIGSYTIELVYFLRRTQ